MATRRSGSNARAARAGGRRVHRRGAAPRRDRAGPRPDRVAGWTSSARWPTAVSPTDRGSAMSSRRSRSAAGRCHLDPPLRGHPPEPRGGCCAEDHSTAICWSCCGRRSPVTAICWSAAGPGRAGTTVLKYAPRPSSSPASGSSPSRTRLSSASSGLTSSASVLRPPGHRGIRRGVDPRPRPQRAADAPRSGSSSARSAAPRAMDLSWR